MCEFPELLPHIWLRGVNSRMGYVWCQLQMFILCALLSLSDQTEVVACLFRLLVLLPLSPPPLYFGRWCRKQASRFCLPGSALTLFWDVLYVQSTGLKFDDVSLGIPPAWLGRDMAPLFIFRTLSPICILSVVGYYSVSAVICIFVLYICILTHSSRCCILSSVVFVDVSEPL